MCRDSRGRSKDAFNFYTDEKVIANRWHSPFEKDKKEEYVKLF